MPVNPQKPYLEFIRSIWPPVIACVSLIFWFGGLVTSRMETPDEKLRRIHRLTDPIDMKIHRLEAEFRQHKAIDGHYVMEERVRNISEQATDLSMQMDKLEQEFTRDFVRKDELGNLIR